MIEARLGWRAFGLLACSAALLLGATAVVLLRRAKAKKTAAAAGEPQVKLTATQRAAARKQRRAEKEKAGKAKSAATAAAAGNAGGESDVAICVTFTLTHQSGERSPPASPERKQRHRTSVIDVPIVASDTLAAAAAALQPPVDTATAAIDALLDAASAVPQGWTTEASLSETIPLGATDQAEIDVARAVLVELWDEAADAQAESRPVGWERGSSRSLLELSAVPMPTPVGWESLTSHPTLLVQYIRGHRQESREEWYDETFDTLQRGLLLRSCGQAQLDGVELALFPDATWTRAQLLERRVPLDDEVHAAFPSWVYGDSTRGHLIHCERTSEVDFNALLRIPLESTLLVRGERSCAHLITWSYEYL